jgi:hypothetical protein
MLRSSKTMAMTERTVGRLPTKTRTTCSTLRSPCSSDSSRSRHESTLLASAVRTAGSPSPSEVTPCPPVDYSGVVAAVLVSLARNYGMLAAAGRGSCAGATKAIGRSASSNATVSPRHSASVLLGVTCQL